MTEPADAKSALNLRALLAAFGLVSCAAIGALALRAGLVALGVVLVVLAVVAAVDLVVVQRRRSARADSAGSLFE